jgi:hypothetical protein
MMVIINKERIVEVPPATQAWLYNNWTKITPENAVLCMEYSERTLNYQWDIDPVQSTKMMDILITKDAHIQTALRNKHLREETLLGFMDGKYKEQIEKDGAAEKVRPKSWGRLSMAQVHYWTGDILAHAKTYQIEMIYKLYADNYVDMHQIHYLLADHTKLEIIPDYIFSRIIPTFYKEDPSRRYDSGRVEAACFREAMRRQMLTTFTPSKTTVSSQPRPTTFVTPTVPTIGTVSVPGLPTANIISIGSMILLPKAPGVGT